MAPPSDHFSRMISGEYNARRNWPDAERPQPAVSDREAQVLHVKPGVQRLPVGQSGGSFADCVAVPPYPVSVRRPAGIAPGNWKTAPGLAGPPPVI